MSVEKKTRGFCFTVFSQFTLDELKEKFECAEYYIFGEEVCPDTGRNHLQCYAYFKNARSLKSVNKMIPDVRLRIANGSPQENYVYCSKEGKFHEKGICPQQGKRTDLDEIREIIKETNSMAKVVEVATSYQSVKMAEQILKYHEKPRNFKPEVIWLWGPTGTGKTRTAYEILGEDCYTCLPTGRWFDGYDAHENVLIDDIRGDFMKFHEFLRLLDRYAFRVETKGGTRQFLAKKIVITCPNLPEIVFPNIKEDMAQLLRRIDEIREIRTGSDSEEKKGDEMEKK